MPAKPSGKIEKKFEQALSLHKQGHTAEARKLYRSILKFRPDHPEALHFLGFLTHQSGDSEEAARLIRKSIGLQPDYADAIKNLGNVLLEMEQDTNSTRGEFVVVVAGAEESDDENLEKGRLIMDVLLSELSVSKAAGLAAKISGARKNMLYEYGVDKKG